MLFTASRVVSTIRVNNQATVTAAQARNGDIFLTHVTSVGAGKLVVLYKFRNQVLPSDIREYFKFLATMFESDHSMTQWIKLLHIL